MVDLHRMTPGNRRIQVCQIPSRISGRVWLPAVDFSDVLSPIKVWSRLTLNFQCHFQIKTSNSGLAVLLSNR